MLYGQMVGLGWVWHMWLLQGGLAHSLLVEETLQAWRRGVFQMFRECFILPTGGKLCVGWGRLNLGSLTFNCMQSYSWRPQGVKRHQKEAVEVWLICIKELETPELPDESQWTQGQPGWTYVFYPTIYWTMWENMNLEAGLVLQNRLLADWKLHRPPE